MNWEQLLSTERLGGKIEIPYPEERFSTSEFEKDYWRIINCAAFRRLQDKTQVFPLDKSDFVRTRLTHSLEVASLAKQLVAMIHKNISQYTKNTIRERYPFTTENAKHATDVVTCASLLHDIGNPPFGHFGEEIVRSWFENHFDDLNYIDQNSDKEIKLDSNQLIQDLKHFEGNAQAFRLLIKLHSVDNKHGLNLTAAVLNTLVKYPTDSLHVNSKSEDNICVHKLGYYETDQRYFEAIVNYTGTYFNNKQHRHPLTFILEAADDIAYVTADIEDSYKKGLFNIDEFIVFFQQEISKWPSEEQKKWSEELIEQLGKYRNKDEHTTETEFKAFQCWVNFTRHWLLYSAAYGFARNYEAIMEGLFQKEIIKGTNHEGSMKILKKAMAKFTFNNNSIIKLELAAESIISGLLDRFIPAAIDWEVKSNARLSNRKAEEKLMTLVSDNHKEAYYKNCKADDEKYNLYLRLLLIADFVSGMTDTYAKDLYQELEGIY